MEQMSDHYIKYARQWFVESIKAVISHYDNNERKFVRTSSDNENEQFSTATFHGYSSLFYCINNCDIQHKQDNKNNKIVINIEAEELEIDQNYIYNFFSIIENGNIGIFQKINKTQNKDKRAVILFEQLLSSIISYQVLNEKLKCGKELPCEVLLDKVKEYVLKNEEDMEKLFYPEVGKSPWFSLILLTCQEYAKKILNSIDSEKEKKSDYSYQIISSEKISKLGKVIDNHINYQMARFNAKELYFDPISLIIAICCKIKIEDSFKKSPFFVSCLKAAIDKQNNDGSWPIGATISFSKTGDVMPEASIQIASYLINAIIDYKFLVYYDERTEEILDILIPSLRKLAKYMEATHLKIEKTTGLKTITGWSNDRTKDKDRTETWITAYASRFFHKYYLAEKAYARIKALKELGVRNFVYNPDDNENHEKSWENIKEPDDILKPKETLEKIINPIIEKRKKGNLLINPEKDHLSFIICGPPGSGKTSIVKCMAKRIGWPLVELSPSQFISKGLELIESRNKEIFDHLFLLHHAVVFFDECDELFKERDSKDEKNTTRTILNFLTASMLPKLQNLHDYGNIIFVVGTNFLSNIDKAIIRKGRFDHRILYDKLNLKDASYKKWCKNTGIKELEAIDASQEDRKKKKKQWGIP